VANGRWRGGSLGPINDVAASVILTLSAFSGYVVAGLVRHFRNKKWTALSRARKWLNRYGEETKSQLESVHPYRSNALNVDTVYALATPQKFVDRLKSNDRCPACADWLGNEFKERFCIGKYSWWRRQCVHRRAHFHQFCGRCGAKWIAEPAKSTLYE
jgi:hypothetical protein